MRSLFDIEIERRERKARQLNLLGHACSLFTALLIAAALLGGSL